MPLPRDENLETSSDESDDEAQDEELQVDPDQRNLTEIGLAVTRRLVDFIAMEDPADQHEENMDEEEILSDEEEHRRYELVLFH